LIAASRPAELAEDWRAPAAAARPLTVSVERVRILLLWLVGATGSIVFIEPSPYELASFLAISVFVLGGLTLRPALLPLGVLLILINIGYSVSASALLGEKGVLAWVLTSWYLAATALFFAAMLGANTEARLAALTRGCLVAIVGYFRVFPSANELLLLYERARGTFKDPNVLGAFMVLPALLALQRIIVGNLRQAVVGMMLMGLFTAAILLSFSRAAWGQVAFTALIVLMLTFVTTRSPAMRLRIVLLAVGGGVALALFLAALLSIDAVAQLFKERASLQQSYDLGEQGRFARHALGAVLALDVPLGIGPLQFSKYFPEDPHNSYLNAFMAGGWISGACYLTLALLSLAFGLRAVFTPTPWQSTTIVVYAGYVGVAMESVIIDTDHWRHTFLLLGLLWGLIGANRSYRLRTRAAASEGAGLARPRRAA
jgi:O-antigen ligase